MTEEQAIKMFSCDTARILEFPDKKYLLIGHRKNTKDDAGQWYRNGEPFDFDYTKEECIASGGDDDELLASAREYKRLCGITMEEYLMEIAGSAE